MPAVESVELWDAGVSADYLRGLRNSGFAHLDFAAAIVLSEEGITPAYARRVREVGLRIDTTINPYCGISRPFAFHTPAAKMSGVA